MEEFFISTDKGLLDISVIHNYLSIESYWAKGIPLETVQQSIENSICFGVYKGNVQLGFARVISDKATFAYLADVFILSDYRGKGLSKSLMQFIISEPYLQGLRKWFLGTFDAHDLYRQFGFTDIARPDRLMEISVQDIY